MHIDPKKLSYIMSILGKRGGSAKSERKTAAARRNAARPRRRFCRGCQAEVTATDREAGACTQCGVTLRQTRTR